MSIDQGGDYAVLTGTVNPAGLKTGFFSGISLREKKRKTGEGDGPGVVVTFHSLGKENRKGVASDEGLTTDACVSSVFFSVFRHVLFLPSSFQWFSAFSFLAIHSYFNDVF